MYIYGFAGFFENYGQKNFLSVMANIKYDIIVFRPKYSKDKKSWKYLDRILFKHTKSWI